MTGTYRFQTRILRLNRPAGRISRSHGRQNYTLIGLKNTYCFLVDILIVSKLSEEEQKQYVLDCLKGLDEKNLRNILPKGQSSELEIDWLEYHISQSGILPLESKTSANLTLEAPKTFKKLQSFLGSVHYISKFLPNRA